MIFPLRLCKYINRQVTLYRCSLVLIKRLLIRLINTTTTFSVRLLNSTFFFL